MILKRHKMKTSEDEATSTDYLTKGGLLMSTPQPKLTSLSLNEPQKVSNSLNKPHQVSPWSSVGWSD